MGVSHKKFLAMLQDFALVDVSYWRSQKNDKIP